MTKNNNISLIVKENINGNKQPIKPVVIPLKLNNMPFDKAEKFIKKVKYLLKNRKI